MGTSAAVEEHGAASREHGAASGHGAAAQEHGASTGHVAAAQEHGGSTGHVATAQEHGGSTGHGAAAQGHGEATGHGTAPESRAGAAAGHGAADVHGAPAGHGIAPPEGEGLYRAKGVTFIDAVIQPMDYELNERWYGWRPNDILDFTDNVNNFQLGVLEVTRRASVVLAERISRTGTTAAFDNHLEDAMNWFMIKADRYWFPSAESKYQEGINDLKAYREKLQRGEAKFYIRSDNLIPLLAAFEDLLGSCDENLVKHAEDDGSHVSFFAADDYLFYAKGVASAMHTILEAVAVDFRSTVEVRRGAEEVLHHAIESCREAMEIDPFIVLNGDWSSLLANHRANMAAPISHARFYLGVLINTLST
jgi:hypothetical protein